MNKAIFNNKLSPFYTELKEEVEKYFQENNISSTGNIQLYLKTFILLFLAMYLYVQLVFFTPTWWIALPLCMLAGVNAAAIGFNIMHDACHGSYSQKKWLNNLMGYSLNLLGSNAFFWKVKHNVVHHTFTNIDGIDSDIVQSSLLRFCPTQPKLAVHRYQHIYGSVLYALSSMVWVFVNDFQKYFSRKVYTTPINGMDTKEHLIFWATKVFYVSVYLIIPMYFVGVLNALIGYLAMNLTLGFVLAIVFQLAHVVEITEFEDAKGITLKIEDEWAIHQVNTTADFATNNSVVTWLLGGLNFQVEHHLFPKVSHIHYPKIQKIVAEVCARFEVKYRVFPTMSDAISSHFRMLRILGNEA